jgi:hypothetical protein
MRMGYEQLCAPKRSGVVKKLNRQEGPSATTALQYNCGSCDGFQSCCYLL